MHEKVPYVSAKNTSILREQKYKFQGNELREIEQVKSMIFAEFLQPNSIPQKSKRIKKNFPQFCLIGLFKIMLANHLLICHPSKSNQFTLDECKRATWYFPNLYEREYEF